MTRRVCLSRRFFGLGTIKIVHVYIIVSVLGVVWTRVAASIARARTVRHQVAQIHILVQYIWRRRAGVGFAICLAVCFGRLRLLSTKVSEKDSL